jgi:anti-anti-sigma factor
MALSLSTEEINGISKITLAGELDGASAPTFHAAIEQVASKGPKRIVLMLEGLTYMASAGLRTLVFAKQKLGANVDIYLVGTQEPVRETLEMTGFHHSVVMLDAYDASEIESV